VKAGMGLESIITPELFIEHQGEAGE